MDVLFVDDEPQVLRGIARMLDAADLDWSCHFAESGTHALEVMEKNPIQALVTDMRMPGMDGAQLLSIVSEQYPETVRIVLSGEVDRNTVFRAVKPMHQYLAKPTRAQELIDTIARSTNLKGILDSVQLEKMIGSVVTLPSLPETYQSLMDEIESDNPSQDSMGEILAVDPAMTAKILQIVNSAIFGLRNRISCPKQAISLLGISTIKSLTLSIGVFQEYAGNQEIELFVSSIFQHSLEVGAFAQKIYQHETNDVELAAETFTAGILHDVGKLLFLSIDPKRYREAIDLSQNKKITTSEAEKEIWFSDHAAVGAYLMNMWGLPQSIVEVVAMHHDPMCANDKDFSMLTAVCAAEEICRSEFGKIDKTTEEYLSSIHCLEKFDSWSSFCLDMATS